MNVVELLIRFLNVSFQNISDGQLHQIWYEDEQSASLKVNLANILGLKGKKSMIVYKFS